MEKKEESLQELDAMVKKRKWKNRLGFAAAAALVLAISAGSIGSYIKQGRLFRQAIAIVRWSLYRIKIRILTVILVWLWQQERPRWA